MSIDSIGFPLPVVVNGYACLTADDLELAEKNIDPARPKEGPAGTDAAVAKASAATTAFDPQRVAAAVEAASNADASLLSYAPGAARTTGAPAPGAVYSIQA